MACPLSLGDILAVVQVCYTIGKRLTVGRLEAIQEFKGVESILYALGESLRHLDNEIKRPGSIFAHGETAQTAIRLVWNCSVKLQTLEKIVVKYYPAMTESELSWGEWSRGLMDNYLRVMWTREEKELTALTSELTLHMTAINNFILTTNSMALGNIDNKAVHILNGIGGLDEKAGVIIDEIRRLQLSKSHCPHPGNDIDKPTTTRSPSPVEKSIPAVSSDAHFFTWRSKHPEGLPSVSEQRCRKIDKISFEFEISEEREDERYLICPNAKLKGFHFSATPPGRIREDLFQCDCKGSSVRRSAGLHTKQLKEYSCGPRTFLAQSHYQISTPLRGKCWWMLQTQTKAGGQKNLFLELKESGKRPQFTETIASMLRTNVARNILSGVTMPFDLARRAKKPSNDDVNNDRLHIAWSYDERRVGKIGRKVRVDKLPGKERIEFSNPMEDPKKRRFSYGDRTQDYFTKEESPNFSWYRVAMFESLNIHSSIEDDDPEDAHFFLDHFNTSVEFKVELSHSKDPDHVYWGVGEFGGVNTEMHKKCNQNSQKREFNPNELRCNISRFTLVKGEDWDSPRPINCSLCFLFPPWSLESHNTMSGILEKYESLSTTTGRSATEFALARLTAQTKENPQFLMRVKNAILEKVSVQSQHQESLNRHDFEPGQTFRDCWLLVRKSENPKAPLKFTLRSMRQDIHCNIYLSQKDALSLGAPGTSTNETTFLELHEPPSKESEKSKTSWCWIYPRELYSVGSPSPINICGSLKLKFISETDFNGFVKSMGCLLNALGLASLYETLPPYMPPENHYRTHRPSISIHSHIEQNSTTNFEDALRRSKTLPSRSEPPHTLRERTSSWSVGLIPPSPELKATGPQVNSQMEALNNRSSMFVITQGTAWEPSPSRYDLPGYQPHVERSDHNWQQAGVPGAVVMPDVDHFVEHSPILQSSSPTMSNDSHDGQGWSGEINYSNYSHGPHLERAWTKPTSDNPKEISSIQRPLSVFPNNPHDSHLMQNTPRYTHAPIHSPPQIHRWQQDPSINYNYNNNGSKRFIVISDHVGSPQNNELSLQAGQIYNFVPQSDGSPWVWIDGNSCGPSGYAPKSNLREYVGS
ncbi:hypothetical protein DFP73DRAFT_174239 [Morchella snyderi]|nr:hypothetical protein DFP73DRAFT_174239 [Morchella snyderi]